VQAHEEAEGFCGGRLGEIVVLLFEVFDEQCKQVSKLSFGSGQLIEPLIEFIEDGREVLVLCFGADDFGRMLGEDRGVVDVEGGIHVPLPFRVLDQTLLGLNVDPDPVFQESIVYR